jgi:hypothetical protein
LVGANAERKGRKMKIASQVLFWFGIICIPLTWLLWYLGLRTALQEAHAERVGIFIAVWPVTLLILSYILEKKA